MSFTSICPECTYIAFPVDKQEDLIDKKCDVEGCKRKFNEKDVYEIEENNGLDFKVDGLWIGARSPEQTEKLIGIISRRYAYIMPTAQERTCPKCKNVSEKPYHAHEAGFHCDICNPEDKENNKPRGRAEALKMKVKEKWG